MIRNRLITENQLDEWVRGNSRDAQGLIVELIWRLVAASSPNPKERRFPLGDSIGQPGPDGLLDTDFSFEPFVPEGRSYWEIGTGLDAGAKATSDYRELTEATPEEVRRESTFIFITPLSGRRDWPHTWKEDAQATWQTARRQQNRWTDVRVIDGTRLIDWLQHFPAVEQWIASKMGLPAEKIQTPEQRWAELRTIGDPPPLTPHIFLISRDKACERIKEVFSGTIVQLKLDTHFPNQVVDFVCAFVESMDKDTKVDTIGRCLIVESADAWNAIVTMKDRHILIADFDIDEADSLGTRLLEKARRAGHAVIFGGKPGGIPHPNCISIPNPKDYQIKEALERAGYNEERARILALKSDGNLSALLRCLQNLSIMPEWAEGTHAAELAIAEILGSWNEKTKADQIVIEGISGNLFGEWIGKIREVALRPGTPLIQHDGMWKVISRYEGWYALGSKIYDEYLDRLRDFSSTVLREKDPKFELQPEERFAASVHGKIFSHSSFLRRGLAETLALLGSHPKALVSCSFGKAEGTAILAVRGILDDADWILWASLNDLLPLLAEAAPEEFLSAVEKALCRAPCPFDAVFSQEGSGIMGHNYMTGLLWALETLAWDAQYLTRVVVIIGELAMRDPGGNWANRPINSLSEIFMPWLPKTCAAFDKRKVALTTLLNELPDIGWKLLLNILPQSHQISTGTRKPEWREIIDVDWSKDVTYDEYWEQINIYSDLAINEAMRDLTKLSELIDRIDILPKQANEKLLDYLSSDSVVSMSQTSRIKIWTTLVNKITKHRKFATAEWEMKPEYLNKLDVIAAHLSPDEPTLIYRRLFSERDFDLFEETADYDEQRVKIEKKREKAIEEIYVYGGMNAILNFVEAVESPWRVGIAFGVVAETNIDNALLTDLICSDTKPLAQFIGGFIWGRFRTQQFHWVDKIDTSKWSPDQIGQLLAYLPFNSETWNRVTMLLENDESPYWTKTNAYPYDIDTRFEHAIECLVKHKRPNAAIRCLHRMIDEQEKFDTHLAVRILLLTANKLEGTGTMDVHEIVEIIKALQDNPNANKNDVCNVEWTYLPILNSYNNASPKLLEQSLANDAKFFCEVIRIVFRSRKEEHCNEEVTEQQKSIATNAYRLLSEWRVPPGSKTDGTFNGEELEKWLNEVKKECEISGHLEIALTMIGHVLTYSPADPNGLWINHSVAEVLNARDANDMRDGFRIQLFNSRGVYPFTNGQAERELAKKYRLQAEEIESHGFHRLANTLRELATSYEYNAERDATQGLFED